VDNTGSVCGYAVNASNGDLTLITTTAVPAGTKPIAAAVAGGNKYLYVANQGSNNVSAYVVNADGSLAGVSGSPFAAGNTPVALSVDPSGTFVYVGNFNDNTLTLFKIGSNGALSSSGTAQTGLNPNAVVVTQ
jgi:6-phosphogluconolactonase (cycloisomerase 2 family)